MVTGGKVGIVAQARMLSTRRPGKILADLNGRPLLYRLAQRMRRSKEADLFVVATSTETADDKVAEFCEAEGIDVFRGSMENVLERYVECARHLGLSGIVRVTADNPLTDPEVVDALIRRHRETGADLVDGIHKRAWVHGAGCEFVTAKALEEAYAEATRQWHTEHVTTFLKDHPDRFTIHKYEAPAELSRNDLFFTVDFPEDMEVMEKIFAENGEGTVDMTTRQVIAFLDAHPGIAAINRGKHQPLPE